MSADITAGSPIERRRRAPAIEEGKKHSSWPLALVVGLGLGTAGTAGGFYMFGGGRDFVANLEQRATPTTAPTTPSENRSRRGELVNAPDAIPYHITMSELEIEPGGAVGRYDMRYFNLDLDPYLNTVDSDPDMVRSCAYTINGSRAELIGVELEIRPGVPHEQERGYGVRFPGDALDGHIDAICPDVR